METSFIVSNDKVPIILMNNDLYTVKFTVIDNS